MAGLERFAHALIDRLRPTLIVHALEDFVTLAKKVEATDIVANMGIRRIPINPEDQYPLMPGYNFWEYYTKYTVKMPKGGRIMFSKPTDLIVLPRTHFPSIFSEVAITSVRSLLQTNRTTHELSELGFNIRVQHNGATYSKEEFEQLVRIHSKMLQYPRD